MMAAETAGNCNGCCFVVLLLLLLLLFLANQHFMKGMNDRETATCVSQQQKCFNTFLESRRGDWSKKHEKKKKEGGSNRTIGRITRDQIERWNQMTAPEIPDRGGGGGGIQEPGLSMGRD